MMRRGSGMSATLPPGGPTSVTKTVPVGQTTVLTSDELARIKTTLLHADAKTHGQTIQTEEEKMRDRLRDMSKTRMGGWNNTLDARRKQKEADRQSKIDEEEKVRQVMDREEAAFQAAERKKAIQRANTLLYENTERVKAFGSKLYLSDVMKERELQLQIKNDIGNRKKAEEKMWHERTIEAVRTGDLEAEKKREEARQRALHAKQVQLDQLEEFRVRYVAGKREERREGELIKQRVEAHLEAEKQAELNRKQEDAARAMKTLADNRRLQEEKRIAEQQAKEDEEQRILHFAEEKERKMRMRAEREAEIAAQKQGIRQRMIDRQVAYLQSLRKNENERIAGQVREAEAKRDAEISAKNEKMRQELEQIRQSHLQQLTEKQQKKQEELQRGEAEANKFLSDYEAGVASDRAAEAARRQQKIDLKQYHLKQAKAKAARKAREREDEDDEQEMVRLKLMEEDLLFEKYSMALVEQYKADGKDVKPLLLELGRMKAEGR
eukprot:CAMPEP_0181307972 /NCGR_PEP_ID=MMETSP1101-20121128/11187_1 /TAXON_ID=46948 /ORGANISM="Rhodomonas abbreviata, Strain Caron Lab Isolate" /LENGTH=494 /DNA_ID=CAMNT_0023414269 /DNA_START=21 /DNA_END=1505 /DNA_ORIENTATION=-